MGEDEERAAIRPAEEDVDGTLGYVDPADRVAGRAVDEDLAIRPMPFWYPGVWSASTKTGRVAPNPSAGRRSSSARSTCGL